METSYELIPCEVCGHLIQDTEYISHLLQCGNSNPDMERPNAMSVPISLFLSGERRHQGLSSIIGSSLHQESLSTTSDDDYDGYQPHDNELYEDRINRQHQIGSGTSINAFYINQFGRNFVSPSASRGSSVQRRHISASIQNQDAPTTTSISINDYDANLMLAARIGVVEIGVSDIERAGKIIDKALLADTDICPICQDQMFSLGDIRRLRCKHDFCDTCIRRWFEKHKKCPVCNFEFS